MLIAQIIWEQINSPNYGSLTKFIISNQKGFIYTGNDNGVFRSDDSITIWEKVLDINGNLFPVINKANGDIFIGISGFSGSIYRSTDDGDSWTNVTNNLSVYSIYYLTIHENNTIWAGTDQGLFYSQDNGSQWIKIPSDFAKGYEPPIKVYKIMFSKDNSIIIQVHSSLFRSKDNGYSWVNITDNVGWQKWIKCFTINSQNEIYISTGDPDAYIPTSVDLYKSSDFGKNWSQMKSTLPDIKTDIFEKDIRDNLYISNKEGFYYLNKSENKWEKVLFENDNICVSAFNACMSGEIMVGTSDGKIFRSIKKDQIELEKMNLLSTIPIINYTTDTLLTYNTNSKMISLSTQFGPIKSFVLNMKENLNIEMIINGAKFIRIYTNENKYFLDKTNIKSSTSIEKFPFLKVNEYEKQKITVLKNQKSINNTPSFFNTKEEEYKIKRNSIFAFYGSSFKTRWIQEYFSNKPWYNINPNYKFQMLNEFDKIEISYIQNIEEKFTIVKYAKKNIACFNDKDDSNLFEVYASKGLMDFQNFAISNVTIYSSAKKAGPIFGELLYQEKSKTIYDEEIPDDKIDRWLFSNYYEGLLVHSYGDEILSITCCSDKFETPDGFAIGRPIEIVLEKYPTIKLENKDEGIISFGIMSKVYMKIKYSKGLIAGIYIATPNG